MPQPLAACNGAPLVGFECRAWWASIADGGAQLQRLLSAPERERCRAYLQADDRRRFETGAALLRLAAAGCLAVVATQVRVDRRCAGCGAQHGKPRLPDHPELDVSVAHSGQHVVVALARGARVGVDVEQVREIDADELAGSAFASGEVAELAALPAGERATAFFGMWTRKESIVKALGTGITDDFFHVSAQTSGAVVHELACAPGYVAALATIGRCDRITEGAGAALLRGGRLADVR